MTPPTTLRPVAALALAAGLFLALPGCGDKPKPDGKGDKKDGPGDPKPLVTDPKKDGKDPNTPPAPVERVDTESGVGKEAKDFLTAVGAGNAKASRLSSGFVKLIGVPAELPSDKAKGYSADAAEAWLRRVGEKLSGMGPMAKFTLVGDVALFRGALPGNATYFLRMVKEGDAWKADWLSMTSAAPPAPPTGGGGDAVLQAFAASAVAAAICDKDAMPQADRVAVIAAGMTPALRASWAAPFGGDKEKGYDYNPTALGLKLAEIGGGAESVTVSPAGDAAFKVEVAKAGGAKSAYTMKLAKGGTAGQWLVESLTPQ